MQRLLQKSSRKHLLLKYLVAAVIIFIPLYPKFPFVRVPGSYVSVRFEDFLLLSVFFVWFLVSIESLGVRNVKRFVSSLRYDWVTISFLLFWGAGLLSYFSAIFLLSSITPAVGALHFFRRVEYMLLFFVGYSALRDVETFRFYMKCFVFTIVIAFVFGIGQKYFAWPVITTQNSEYSSGVALRYMPGGHLVSTFAGHYDLAIYVVIMSTLFVSYYFAKPSSFVFPGSKQNKLLLFMAFCMGLWLIGNAASRITFAGYVISICFTLFLLRKYLYIPVFLVVSLVTLNASTNLLARYIRIIDVALPQVFHMEPRSFSPFGDVYAATVAPTPIPSTLPTPTASPEPVFEDRSTNIRLNASWPKSIRAFEKNPLLGTGYSSLGLATDSDYLRLLGEVGLFGFITFGIVLLRVILLVLRTLLKKSRDFSYHFSLGFFTALPGIFLTAVFIDIFEASKFAIIFWLLAGFAVSSAYRIHHEATS